MKTVKSLLIVAGGTFLLVGGLTGCRRSGTSAAKLEEKPAAAVSATGETIQSEGNDATVRIEAPDTEGYDLPFREEIRRKYVLKPQSTFRVYAINGPVRVESVDGDTAELVVIRSANRKEDLQYNRIAIKHEPEESRLRVYREDDHKTIFSAFKKVPEGRQRVMVRLPRKIDFIGRGVNGGIDLEAVEGSLDVSGVNGRLRVASQTGPVEVNGQNGEIDITFARFTGSPIEMNGINGEITLRFADEVNATVVARGNNGKVTSDLPGFQPQEDEDDRGLYRARIGLGGAEIELHGINGDIRLLKAAAKTATIGQLSRQ
ncbi:MAG: DUF4097 family beta strand repeat-containing protein [Blastocatellia bacterium]